MQRKLQTNSHCKNLILYHFIIVCKYRHTLFTNSLFAKDIKNKIIDISTHYDFSIDTIDLDYSKPDHIHILVRSIPKLSPLQTIRIIKQQTTIYAWNNWEDYLSQFYWYKHLLWTKGYFCSTVGNVSAEIVTQYLESQGNKNL